MASKDFRNGIGNDAARRNTESLTAMNSKGSAVTFKEEAVEDVLSRMANRPSSTAVNLDVATVPCCYHDVR